MRNPFNNVRQHLAILMLVRSAFRHVWKSGPKWMLLSIVLLLVQGLMPLASLYLTKMFVDAFMAVLAAADKAAAIRELWPLLIGAACLWSVSVALAASSSLVTQLQQIAFSQYMDAIIIGKSIEMDLAFYESPKYYDTLHRAQVEGGSRPVQIVNGLARLAQNAISLVAVGSLCVSLHWLVGLVMVLGAVPPFLLRIRYAEVKHKWAMERTPLVREADYLRYTLAGPPSAKEVRLFQYGPLFLRRLLDLRRTLKEQELRLTLRLQSRQMAAKALSILALGGAMGFLFFRVLHGTATPGDLAMYYQGVQRATVFVDGMFGGLTTLYEDALFLSHLEEFLKLSNSVAEPEEPQTPPLPVKTSVEFDHVSFAYPGDAREVLKDVTMSVAAGETIAIVGENGAGKTTIIKLLCRLYDPSDGAIRADGIDLKDMSPREWRRRISPIFQDFHRYAMSVKENIWLGDVRTAVESEPIEAASRQAGAHDFITRLPEGYETRLGSLFGTGTEISLGQWQKLALARALYRKGSIIVLDEPTSSQDPRAEHEFFATFRELAKDSIAVIVSHRFSTVRMADRVCVLEDGRITEQGTHNELMELQGTYAKLYSLQAAGWK